MADGLRLHESVTLDSLEENPERVRALDADTAFRLLGDAIGRRAGLDRLAALLAARAVARPDENADDDGGLLSLDEAARRAGLTPESLRRRRCFRPALVRIGHRSLRVDGRKLARILDRATGLDARRSPE